MPFFPLTWTLIHELDDASAVKNALSQGEDGSEGLRLLLTISARDPALDATVSVLKTYGPNDVQHDAHYVDAVSWDGENRSIADMRKISVTEPDLQGAP